MHESSRISARPDALVKLLSMELDESDSSDQESLRARSEQAIGELAQALLDSHVLENAVAAAFGAREKALEAQQAAMSALNLPSAGDVERLERRLRSLSQRLEEVEDQIDRVSRESSATIRRQIAAEKRANVRRANPRLEVESTAEAARPARFPAVSSSSASTCDRRRRSRRRSAPPPRRFPASARGRGAARSACRRRRPPSARARWPGWASKLATSRRRRRSRELVRQALGQVRVGRDRSPAATPSAVGAAARGDRLARRPAARPARPRSPTPDAGADPHRPPHAQLGEVGEHQRGARPAHPGRLDRQRRARRRSGRCSPTARGRGCSSSAARAAPGRAAGPARGRRRGSRQLANEAVGRVGTASSSDPIAPPASSPSWPFRSPSQPPLAAVPPRGRRSPGAGRACASTRRRSSCRSRSRRRAAARPRVSTVG